jgi:hypothetical protein
MDWLAWQLAPWFVAVVSIAGLLLLAGENYLLFHSVVEVAGIAVAFAIFLLVWNTRAVLPDSFFLLLGISFLYIGSLDLVHTVAYKGMGVFPGDSADPPTQIWIAA